MPDRITELSPLVFCCMDLLVVEVVVVRSMLTSSFYNINSGRSEVLHDTQSMIVWRISCFNLSAAFLFSCNPVS